MKTLLVIVSTLFFSFFVAAGPVDTYEFKNEQLRDRYQTLVKELRCPKCQNQNLADSNSQIAVDLRAKVYEMINENQSDDQIVDFMVSRYGDFVLYSPRVNKQTYILWFGPIVLFLIGVVIVFFMLRNKKEQPTATVLSAEEQQKLQQLLKDK